MNLDELLLFCCKHHIILQPRGQRLSLWSGGNPIARETRNAIRAQTHTLLELLHIADYRVCPSPAYHRQYWYYRQSHFICGACERLQGVDNGTSTTAC